MNENQNVSFDNTSNVYETYWMLSCSLCCAGKPQLSDLSSGAGGMALNVTPGCRLRFESQRLRYGSFQTPLCSHNGLIPAQQENTSGPQYAECCAEEWKHCQQSHLCLWQTTKPARRYRLAPCQHRLGISRQMNVEGLYSESPWWCRSWSTT